MSRSFHDINLPAHSFPKKKEEPEKKLITGVDDSELEDEPIEPEARLISAQWKAGPKGFQYNEQCFLEVKAEYLKKTIRSRIRGKLFGVYDGVEVDLCQEVYGHIEKDGIAMMDIQHLWFVNHRHYHAWRKDKQVLSSYQIKNIQHSRGENKIDSPVLEMPRETNSIEILLEIDPPVANIDKFRLVLAGENEGDDFCRELPVDDKCKDGEFFRLVFDDLPEDKSFNLTIVSD